MPQLSPLTSVIPRKRTSVREEPLDFEGCISSWRISSGTCSPRGFPHETAGLSPQVRPAPVRPAPRPPITAAWALARHARRCGRMHRVRTRAVHLPQLVHEHDDQRRSGADRQFGRDRHRHHAQRRGPDRQLRRRSNRHDRELGRTTGRVRRRRRQRDDRQQRQHAVRARRLDRQYLGDRWRRSGNRQRDGDEHRDQRRRRRAICQRRFGDQHDRL